MKRADDPHFVIPMKIGTHTRNQEGYALTGRQFFPLFQRIWVPIFIGMTK